MSCHYRRFFGLAGTRVAIFDFQLVLPLKIGKFKSCPRNPFFTSKERPSKGFKRKIPFRHFSSASPKALLCVQNLAATMQRISLKMMLLWGLSWVVS